MWKIKLAVTNLIWIVIQKKGCIFEEMTIIWFQTVQFFLYLNKKLAFLFVKRLTIGVSWMDWIVTSTMNRLWHAYRWRDTSFQSVSKYMNSSYTKCFVSHQDLIEHYRMCISQMLVDMLPLSFIFLCLGHAIDRICLVLWYFVLKLSL